MQKDLTDEEIKKLGESALNELRMMFKAWLKSDFKWAIGKIICGEGTGEEGEWDFLFSEWRDKLENWMSPYVFRLYRTNYITKDDLKAFGTEMYDNMDRMLEAIYTLRGDVDNGKES